MKVIKIRGAQASKLSECANKAYKASKKLMGFIEDEILDSESMDERNGGSGSGMGGGNFRDEDYDDDDEWEDDEDMNKRRGVPGTGRYGRSRYRRGRY